VVLAKLTVFFGCLPTACDLTGVLLAELVDMPVVEGSFGAAKHVATVAVAIVAVRQFVSGAS
jgi:hypothetical protein